MSQEIINFLIAALIGVFLIVLGNYKRDQYNKLIAFGIKTEATVISLEAEADSDGVTYSPKVSYTNNKNENIIKQYSIGSNPATYKVGDSVTIFYDENDNEEFIIDNQGSKYLGPAFITAGVIIVIVCIFKYFVI